MNNLGKITTATIITGVLIFGGVVSANAEPLSQTGPSISSQLQAGNGNHTGGGGKYAGSKKGTGTGQNAGSKKGTGSGVNAGSKKGTNNTGAHRKKGTKSQSVTGTLPLYTH